MMDEASRGARAGVLERRVTVRTWFTISALVLVALAVAAVVRIVSPLPAPRLLATASGRPLEGAPVASCWPQRSGDLRCLRSDDGPPADATPVPADGRLRIIADFPVQPVEGVIRLVDTATDEAVIDGAFTDRIDYDLQPGRYLLRVEARWGEGAFVRYAFALAVPR